MPALRYYNGILSEPPQYFQFEKFVDASKSYVNKLSIALKQRLPRAGVKVQTSYRNLPEIAVSSNGRNALLIEIGTITLANHVWPDDASVIIRKAEDFNGIRVLHIEAHERILAAVEQMYLLEAI